MKPEPLERLRNWVRRGRAAIGSMGNQRGEVPAKKGDKLRWGMLGAGMIAKKFARGISESRTGRLVAVSSRRSATSELFAAEHSAPTHGEPEALLADPEVQVVYISTPHPFHAEWAIKAAEAGKHALCEKPLAMNHAEAAEVVAAARSNGVFLMETFMYRCQPQTELIRELIRNKAVGDVRLIEATFSFRAAADLNSRLLSRAAGSWDDSLGNMRTLDRWREAITLPRDPL
jgi:predicted dehydrogenase